MTIVLIIIGAMIFAFAFAYCMCYCGKQGSERQTELFNKWMKKKNLKKSETFESEPE